MRVPMRFAVLGGLHAWRDGIEVELGPRQPRLMAAMLLARTGQLVTVSELVGLLYGDEPPPTAVNVVHRHIGAIRRVVEPGLARRAEGEWLVRRPGGYRLTADAGTLDLLCFRRLATSADANLRSGRREAAITAYRKALDLWHGRFGEGLGADTHPLFVAVNRERAVVARAAAGAAAGTAYASSLLPALHAAAAAEPFDEHLQAALLTLLAASGRPAEAIEYYHRFRERLAADLSTDPGRELTAAFEGILREPHETPAAPTPSLAPAQLPPASTLFIGRRDELAALHRFLDDGAEHRNAAAVIALDGMPGVGKTALAVHWAHEIAHRFPDGQLHLDLRGFGRDEPMPAGEAQAQLLGALGLPGSELPANIDSWGAMFRTWAAGRRMLILLDDAADDAQVRPLIPAAPDSLVLITGRGRLTGLAASDGARLLAVDVPPAEDAEAQLLARLGVPFAGSAALVELSGRLPLALAIVGARMSAYAPTGLPEIADILARAPGLDAFTGDDPGSDLRAVLARSYERLSPDAARLFRRLRGAADEVGPVDAGLLAELAGTGLITHRHALHPLVRAYAIELGTAGEEGDGATQQAGDVGEPQRAGAGHRP